MTSHVSDSGVEEPSPGSLIIICLVKTYGLARQPVPPLLVSFTIMVGIPQEFTTEETPSTPLNQATVDPDAGISLIHSKVT